MNIGIRLPREVQRGRAATLTLPVYADDGTELAPASGTLTIKVGGSVIVDAVPVSSVGPPVSYSLLAATTESLALSEEWLETWTLDIGVLTHTGYLVRTGYVSRLTDAVLQGLHPEILDQLPPGETTAQKFRVAATEQVQRDLIKRGRRPWLVFDAWALLDAECYYALYLWAQDRRQATSGSSEWARLSSEYLARYRNEMDTATFRYDEGETGTVDADVTETASPPALFLTAGPRRRQVYR